MLRRKGAPSSDNRGPRSSIQAFYEEGGMPDSRNLFSVLRSDQV